MRAILFWLSQRESFDDEAFNDDPPRELGAITAAFRATGDEAAMRIAIRGALASGRNLKHCVENVPFRMNSVLLEEAVERGYRHVMLLRLNEIDRQVSLEMARHTGTWGPDEARGFYDEVRAGTRSLPRLNIKEMCAQADSDAAALGKLLRLFMTLRVSPATIFFEDLYTGELPTRFAAFRQVAKSVGIPDALNLADGVFHTAAVESGQGSAAMFPFLPNYDEAVSALKQVIK